MNYGKVINQGLSAVWRHKALWLLGCLGVVLGGLGSGFNSVFQIRWQLDFLPDRRRFGFLNNLRRNGFCDRRCGFSRRFHH